MKSHFEIIKDVIIPPKKCLTDEEKRERRKIIQNRINAKRSKEDRKADYLKQRYENKDRYRATQLKAQNNFKSRRLEWLENLAGRPKPENCEICNRNNLRICFDHCHKTGKFRGWLCDDCNKLLGNAHDNIDVLEKCINYLKTNS